ncbi:MULTISPECIES: energy-coupling factor transporter transmembrane component T family protein [Alphaproteobacteria]|uniref:Transporter n=2 Tax=Alphaproteobacteria TaxID=28211 RepID=A0A512HFJ9_9HYPH|nr:MULTISPECIES: energy-coupling factor transporter transmembrane protein EcfT [Alphaproteobacteria]GEO84140.1 transporter [Ciceribacter naphthalenivorans]GLR24676.1 transporter [Ciceribacter naphthalenivorans]GLT07532.1 transporter [Sphingomonas psychrolutea]
MRSLFVSGNSLMHRLPPAVKIGGLALVAVLIFLTRDPRILTLVLLVATGLYFSLGQPPRAALSPLRPVFLTILIVGLFHLLLTSAEEAMVTVLRLSTLMLLGAAVTATTTVSAFIETVTKAAFPLERAGLVKASDIGLAVGLVVRFVPEILTRYEAIREAHRARGVRPKVTTILGPLIIATLKDADNIAAAIDARGIRGQ